MKNIKCADCGHSFSLEEKFCPVCAWKVPDEQRIPEIIAEQEKAIAKLKTNEPVGGIKTVIDDDKTTKTSSAKTTGSVTPTTTTTTTSTMSKYGKKMEKMERQALEGLERLKSATGSSYSHFYSGNPIKALFGLMLRILFWPYFLLRKKGKVWGVIATFVVLCYVYPAIQEFILDRFSDSTSSYSSYSESDEAEYVESADGWNLLDFKAKKGKLSKMLGRPSECYMEDQYVFGAFEVKDTDSIDYVEKLEKIAQEKIESQSGVITDSERSFAIGEREKNMLLGCPSMKKDGITTLFLIYTPLINEFRYIEYAVLWVETDADGNIKGVPNEITSRVYAVDGNDAETVEAAEDVWSSLKADYSEGK